MIDYTFIAQDHWYNNPHEYGQEADEVWVYLVSEDGYKFDTKIEDVALARVKFSGQLWRQMFGNNHVHEVLTMEEAYARQF